MALGALPRPGRVPEQRLLSPEIRRRRAAELRNSFWKFADSFRVFRPEASYRQRGIIGSGPGWPHNEWARPGLGRAPLLCGQPLAPLRLPFGPRPSSGTNRSSRTCFV
jgi:hypothetical protein